VIGWNAWQGSCDGGGTYTRERPLICGNGHEGRQEPFPVNYIYM